ncbi:capsid cement protein [Luteimonas soli]|uniref:Capsid cement protein n=1 Tax=Luteimonas soli TaxID=1648966 RepID=A0ABV7XMP2_9GAMM
MSQKHSLLTLTILAAAALTAQRFVTTAGAVATAAGNADGVAATDAAIGDLVPVDVAGTAVVTAGAAIAAGAYVQVGTDGKAITQASGGAAVGKALEAASADGDPIEILLIPNAPTIA